MHQKLNTVIAESGIWDGTRRQSHAFRLSPSVYKITKAQRKELAELGHALYDCMLGLSHIATVSYDKKLNYGGKWMRARRIFSTGVPKIYQALQGMNVRHVPKLLKVDLMVDLDGNFKIAEVDGHNKHGLGYSTLGMRFREALYPDAKILPGAVATLAAEVKRLGYNEVKLFYADQERFYIPEFEIASQELQRHGISCPVVSEMKATKEFVQSGLFLDLPFLYHEAGLYKTIIDAYKAGDVSFIIPPKPFLGAKAVLAFLRNDGGDEYIEAMLRTFIKKKSLELARQYIPETLLVGRKAEGFDAVKKRVAEKRYVLKESISSGMKGTVFSDDPKFDAYLTKACDSNMNWILQEEVVNQSQRFSWFENADGIGDGSDGNNGAIEPELKTEDGWFMRVTTQYVNRTLADVIITARQDKSVHGAKDCIQLGTIIV